MRHGKTHRKLKRTASHRKALLAALSTSLLKHKKIRTTVAKAKETRMFVEKLITRAKHAYGRDDRAKNVHERRMVGRFIRDKEVVKELFTEIAGKVSARPGGYTRIVKLGRRPGDGAEVAVLELVDFQGAARPEKPTKTEKSAKHPKGSKGEGTAPAEKREKKSVNRTTGKMEKSTFRRKAPSASS
jgi:large subunit ribosomal protein L17